MRGKYSPTVTRAYMADQGWWDKYVASQPDCAWRDPEGYDSYGYNDDGYDRAGNHENDYILDDDRHDDEYDGWGSNGAYDSAASTWGFDGVKPVPRS